MWLNLIIKNTKIQSLILLGGSSLIGYLFLFGHHFNFGNWTWLFPIISTVFFFLLLHLELRNLLGKLTIIQVNRVNYFQFVWGVIFFILAFFETKDYNIVYLAIGLMMLFRRCDYIALSNDYIECDRDEFLKGNRIKIVWGKILNVDINYGSLIIESESKKIKIIKRNFVTKDISLIIKMIYSKVDVSKIRTYDE